MNLFLFIQFIPLYFYCDLFMFCWWHYVLIFRRIKFSRGDDVIFKTIDLSHRVWQISLFLFLFMAYKDPPDPTTHTYPNTLLVRPANFI